MWICYDCEAIFESPGRYTEKYGLDTPPYYEYCACPKCGGAFTETYQCDDCGEWITGPYIKLNSGERICEKCYTTYEIGEEN